ncbi:MAG: sugar phosphate isomerase/epimerase family protein [Bacteroidota bacterium]
MNTNKSRRVFMKSMLAVPFVASGISPLISSADSISQKFGHKFKTSLNVYSFNKLLRDGDIDLFDVLDFCADYNFDAIDPTGYYFPGYPEVPSDDFIRKFKKRAFQLGLDISGTGIRNDFTVPDTAEREADIKMIREWIIAAAKIGIPNIRIFAGKTKHEGFTRNQVFEWMAKDVKKCCEIGKEYGVIIAIQNHNDFLKTAADVERIFEMVDSEWLGLNLDVGSYREHNPYDEIEKTIKYAVTWQIKENMWFNGKETPTNLVKLFKLIKKGNYRGYLPIETLGTGDPYKKVPAMLEKINKAMELI